jgi:hypothetical protein
MKRLAVLPAARESLAARRGDLIDQCGRRIADHTRARTLRAELLAVTTRLLAAEIAAARLAGRRLPRRRPEAGTDLFHPGAA